jgi:hypothetical protein
MDGRGSGFRCVGLVGETLTDPRVSPEIVHHPLGGGGGACKQYGQCSNAGPWLGFCCPNGFTCQPASQSFRTWSCQSDVTDKPPVPDDGELLTYPPRKLRRDACACRIDGSGERVASRCPSPWKHPAGIKQVR